MLESIDELLRDMNESSATTKDGSGSRRVQAGVTDRRFALSERLEPLLGHVHVVLLLEDSNEAELLGCSRIGACSHPGTGGRVRQSRARVDRARSSSHTTTDPPVAHDSGWDR